jgi:kinesin family protein 3/17
MAHERITALDLGLLGGPMAGSKQYRPPPRGVKELHSPMVLHVQPHPQPRPLPQELAPEEDSIFGDKNSSKSSKNFKVVVRVRPLIARELAVQQLLCVRIESKQVVEIHPEAKTGQEQHQGAANLHSFVFDRVYDQQSTQQSVYESAVKPIVHSILKGYNGSIIAYGQTGTGKTFTIEGGASETRGVIPRVSEEIFNYIEKSTDAKSKFLVRVSFLQIYNEKIMDLIQPNFKREFPGDKVEYLKIREAVSGGVYVERLSEHIVRSPSEVLSLLHKGGQHRTTADTKMNHESSRSHAVFTVIVEHSEINFATQQKQMTIGKLNLVDLAGSERLKLTGAEGVRLEEARRINTSLAAFGKVILALTTPGSTYTPYRDSTLTRLLQDSLGGNCKTVIITTITPSSTSYQESLSSLKFANKAKSVKNYAVVNEDTGDKGMLSTYEKEIKRLRTMLEQQQTRPVSSVELKGMESQLKEANREKAAVMNELQKTSAEVMKAQAEKEELSSKIQALEEQLLTGGTKAEDTEEFKEAVRTAHQQLQNEYDSKLQQLQREREELEKEKEMFKKQQEEVMRGMEQLDLENSQNLSPRTPSSRGRLSSAGSVGSGMGDRRQNSEEERVDELQDYIRALMDPETGIPLQQGLFTGRAAVKWFQANLHEVSTVEKAAQVGQRFIELNIIGHLSGVRVFGTQESDLYQFLVVPPGGVSGGVTYLRQQEPGIMPSMSYGSMNVIDGTYGRSTSALSLRFDQTAFSENDHMASPLHHAARKGERSVVKSLVPTYGVDCMDTQGKTALMYAVIADKAKCCETLLKLGSNPNALDANGRTALLWAAYFGHADSMRSLMKSPNTNPDIADPDGRTVLHWATKPESIECIRVIGRFCANIVNKWDNQKTTPLHWAVLCQHPAHVSILLKSCGADPLITDGEGRTALHYATSKLAFECCQVLLEHCPQLVNATDSKGRSPLHLAVTAKGSIEIVQLLLSVEEIDVNMADKQKTTAVHWAVVGNRPDMLDVLVKFGAKTTLADAKKMQPIHYALQRQHTECVKVIQRMSSSQPALIPRCRTEPASGGTGSRQHSARINVDSFGDVIEPMHSSQRLKRNSFA